MGFPIGSVVKNLSANAGDAEDEASILGLGRSPRDGNGNPLQYSGLENSMDSIVHRVAESYITEQLSFPGYNLPGFSVHGIS